MIRPAVEGDLGELMAMILELAEFENLSDQVECTEEDLQRVLFGPDAFVKDVVVEAEDGSIAGHALYYRSFSTFLGQPGIWLEDIYVRPDHRRQGHAAELMSFLREQSSGRLEWEVLDWNLGAVNFYQGLGARPMGGWTRYRWLLQP
ncbi:MAG TPA: GNAT family N-acetyltransferase [Acidimicrobiales bacterium]|jgi:GNAT superfamily N-acetyltransferase